MSQAAGFYRRRPGRSTREPGPTTDWRFGTGLPGVYHMRHTALPENRFVRGQPAKGAELAEDLMRFVTTYGGENIAAVFVEPVAAEIGIQRAGTPTVHVLDHDGRRTSTTFRSTARTCGS